MGHVFSLPGLTLASPCCLACFQALLSAGHDKALDERGDGVWVSDLHLEPHRAVCPVSSLSCVPSVSSPFHFGT